MSDPTDFKALEELSFITGNLIVPLIAPEVQILQALENYYGVTRDHRYVWANSNLQNRRDSKPPDWAESLVSDSSKYTISADFSGNEVFKDLLHVPIPADLHAASPFGDPADYDLPPKQSPEIYTFDRLSLDFSKAKNRDDVARIFIKYLGLGFKKGALLTIRGHSAVGWRAVNGEKQIKDFESVTLDVTKSSELSEILIGKHFFFGPLSESPANMPIIRSLNLKNSETVLSLPIVMNNRVVAMIVVSSDVISLRQRLEELQKLVYKASLTFQILVLKNKLLQT
jgi:hypothetical protein